MPENMLSKIDYCLHLADNALILCHKNAAWCGHAPSPELDIALTNISLDLIGQARNFYQYAATLINENNAKGDSVTDDHLAFLRDVNEFKNCLLTEIPNGDWGQTMLRQFLFSNYQYFLFQQLINSKDEQIAAIAEKSIKETTYHLRWSSEWVIRLGDGTPESHSRMVHAVQELWPYTGELFLPADYEMDCLKSGIGADLELLKKDWWNKTHEIFSEATLSIPGKSFVQDGGKYGKHTENMIPLLTELQYMQRAYPGCEW
ncbi:MAG: phenylacetate-CoA oxygenase subunit PaaC [Bacteroidetes bacterium]|nr:phenylacetate-CoA oxygenase subunit PaaC [Bacteroidota bacterium]